MELDEATVRRVAAIAADDPSLEVLDWSVEPIGGGMTEALGISEGVVRVAGVGAAGGRRVPWSVIRKRLTSAPGHEHPSDWDYWKREGLAYDAGILGELADGFAAPTCFAVEDDDADAMTVWLEDVPQVGPPNWPLTRYGLAARHLGRFNGAYLAGRALPTQPWLSPGRLRSWLAISDPAMPDLRRLAGHPFGSAWLTEGSLTRIESQSHDRERLLAGLDRLPRCLCHHDAFRRNLIASKSSDGLDLTVAVDWVGLGRGAVGEDLAGLVAISLQFLDVDAADAGELDRIAFAGYIAGLRDVGATIDGRRVRFGYAATASLMIGVGGAAGWLAWLVADAGHVRQAEEAIGHPIDRDPWPMAPPPADAAGPRRRGTPAPGRPRRRTLPLSLPGCRAIRTFPTRSTSTRSCSCAVRTTRRSCRRTSSTRCSRGTWRTGRSCGTTACLVANGPLGEQSDPSLRGLSIFSCDLVEARRLSDLDPSVQAGRLAYDVFEWWVAAGTLAFLGTAHKIGERRAMPDD